MSVMSTTQQQQQQQQQVTNYCCRPRKYISLPGSKIQKQIPISTQENFSQKENFVKCVWRTQIFSQKKFRRKFSTFNNDIFGKFSVRGNALSQM
jgi:hypothetical protein